MTIPNKNQFKLIAVFYKSTLLFSIVTSVLLGVLNYPGIYSALIAFGFCYLSAGTVISLLYKEVSKKHEYYFYYNKGITKQMLIVSCILANLFIGLTLIAIAIYAQHF